MDGFRTRTDVKFKKIFRHDSIDYAPTISNNFLDDYEINIKKTTLAHLVNENNTILPTSFVDDVYMDSNHSLSDEVINKDTFNIVWMSGDPNVVCRHSTNECFSRNRVIDLPTGKMMGRIDLRHPCYSDTVYTAKIAVNGSTSQTTTMNIPMDYIDTVVCDDPAGSVFMYWRGKDGAAAHTVALYKKVKTINYPDWELVGTRTTHNPKMGYCNQIQKPLQDNLKNKATCVWLIHGQRDDEEDSTQRFQTQVLSSGNNDIAYSVRDKYGYYKDGKTSSYPSHLIPCVDADGNITYILRNYRPYKNKPDITTEILMQMDRPNPIMDVVKLDIPMGATDNDFRKEQFFTFQHMWPHSRHDRDLSNGYAFAYTHGVTSRTSLIDTLPSTGSIYPAFLWHHMASQYKYTFFPHSENRRLVGIYTNKNTRTKHPVLLYYQTVGRDKKYWIVVPPEDIDSSTTWPASFDQITREPLLICEVPYDPVLVSCGDHGVLIYRPLTAVSNTSVMFISFKTQPASRVVWAYNQRAKAISLDGESRMPSHPYDIREARVSRDESNNNKFYVDFYNPLITPDTKVHVHIKKELNMDYDKIENLEIDPETVEQVGYVRVYFSNLENVRNLTADLEIHI